MIFRSESFKHSVVSFMIVAMMVFVLQPVITVATVRTARAAESSGQAEGMYNLLLSEVSEAGLEVSDYTLRSAAQSLKSGDFESAMRQIEQESLARTISQTYSDEGVNVNDKTLENVVMTIAANDGSDIEGSLEHIQNELYSQEDDFEVEKPPMDLNSAGKDKLMELDGIGPATAESIISYRESSDGFSSVEELDEVDGIGPATIEGVREEVMVSGVQTESDESSSSSDGSEAGQDDKSSGEIDVNTASKEKLETLDGIGSVTAESIISYRESNDGFSSVEELDEVDGIGSATLDGIRDAVTVTEDSTSDGSSSDGTTSDESTSDDSTSTSEDEETNEQMLDEASEDEEVQESRSEEVESTNEQLRARVQSRLAEISELNSKVEEEASIYASELSKDLNEKASSELKSVFKDNALQLAKSLQRVREGGDVKKEVLRNSEVFEKAMSSGVKALAMRRGLSKDKAEALASNVSGNSFKIAKYLFSGDNPKKSFQENASAISEIVKDSLDDGGEQLGLSSKEARAISYGGKYLVKMASDVSEGKTAKEALLDNATGVGITAGYVGKALVDNAGRNTSEEGLAYHGIKTAVKIGGALGEGKSVQEALMDNLSGISSVADYGAEALAKKANLDSYLAGTVGKGAETAIDIAEEYKENGGDLGKALLEKSDDVGMTAGRIAKVVAKSNGLTSTEGTTLKNAVEASADVIKTLSEEGSMETALKENQSEITDVLSRVADHIGERKGLSEGAVSNVKTAIQGGEITDLLSYSKDFGSISDNKKEVEFESSGGELSEGSDEKVEDFVVYNIAEAEFEKEFLNKEGEVSGEVSGVEYEAEGKLEARAEASGKAQAGKFGYYDNGDWHSVYGAKAEGEVSAVVEASGEAHAEYSKDVMGTEVKAFADAEGSAEVGAKASGEAYAGVIDGEAVGVHAEGEAFVGAKAEGEVSTGVSAAGVTGTVGAEGSVGVGLGASGTFDVQVGWDGISWDVGGGAYVGVGGEIETSGSLDFGGAFDYIAENSDKAFKAVEDKAKSAWDTVSGWF